MIGAFPSFEGTTMPKATIAPNSRPVPWRTAILGLLCLLLAAPLYARMLPGDGIRQLINPWPPVGWSATLDLPDQAQAQSHDSVPRLGPGYFGQTLYRHISGTREYWTANVLIQDRGSPGAAWRAVSAVNCSSRIYQGFRARECVRGDRSYLIKSLHYEVDRFYVTVQVRGPGDMDYPWFELGGPGGGYTEPPQPDRPVRRGSSRIY